MPRNAVQCGCSQVVKLCSSSAAVRQLQPGRGLYFHFIHHFFLSNCSPNIHWRPFYRHNCQAKSILLSKAINRLCFHVYSYLKESEDRQFSRKEHAESPVQISAAHCSSYREVFHEICSFSSHFTQMSLSYSFAAVTALCGAR